MPKSLAERLWSNTEKRADGCWIWLGRKGIKGYGALTVSRRGRSRVMAAHRLAYELVHGPLGKRLCCHTCDVRACINPAHLYAGTHLDNARDSRARGWRPHTTKLSDADVADIRARCWLTATSTELARQYHVSRGTICDVMNYRSHVPGATRRKADPVYAM